MVDAFFPAVAHLAHVGVQILRANEGQGAVCPLCQNE
jgi:hypothetical protein